MASWKKVLVSGSSIEVNEITASGVPELSNSSNLLSIDPNTGGITQISQGAVVADGSTFNIQAFDTSSGTQLTETNFDSGADLLLFSASFDHGFGFKVSETNNTASVLLQTPQALKTSSSPEFDKLTIADRIMHAGDTSTTLVFGEGWIDLYGGNQNFLRTTSASAQSEAIINTSGIDIDFRVEGTTNTHLLYTDAGADKVAIGTGSVDPNSLLKVDGNINVAGITGSFPTITNAKFSLVVDPVTNTLVKKQNIGQDIGNATASFSSSIVGTALEVEVTAPGPGEVQIGLPDDVTITSDLTIGDNLDLTGGNITVTGNISASGNLEARNITASNLQVANDIALGGNIFSFSGFSFIEGVSANFSGSNVFGSGSSPGANDIAGGGTAHQFTGSVGITGSALTLIGGDLSLDVGSVTATSNTGSFGYLTAPEISSSGHLFASLSNDDSTITDAVVVYDNATGQFFTTASAGVGVTVYGDLADIPDLIVSGAIGLSQDSTNQGQYDLTVGGVVVSNAVHANLRTSDTPTFAGLTITGNTALGNGGDDTVTITGNLTASGVISGSNHLFASLSLNNSDFSTVMYDTTTGQFFHTGSYGGGSTDYSDINNIPSGIVSGSTFSSNNQGGITASINGVSSSFDVGLTTVDSPTFNSITATGNVSVTGNTTIGGNLVVEGNTTTIATTNMIVEDRFILLASGSAGDTYLDDGGIIVEQTAAGLGVALYWDTSEQNWAIDKAGADHTSETGGVTADVNVVTVQLNAGDGTTPTSSPIMGVDGNANEKGHFYVDTNDEFGLYVYT